MTKNAKEVDVQWFVYCGNKQIPNESLAAALNEIGITEAEAKHPGMQCSDGKKRDVWHIPANFVDKLRAAKQSDARYAFRFFKRNGSEGVIYPADFIEKPRKSVFLLMAQEDLRKRQSRAKAANKK